MSCVRTFMNLRHGTGISQTFSGDMGARAGKLNQEGRFRAVSRRGVQSPSPVG